MLFDGTLQGIPEKEEKGVTAGRQDNNSMVNNYVSIDLETTGLNPKDESIIEIGAVKVIDGKTVETLQTFVNPQRQLSRRITELTGITQQQADSGIGTQEAIQKVIDFVGSLPIMAHSVMFDYAFLKRAAVNHGFCFEKTGIDTLKLARRYLTQAESRSLEYLCRYYKIEHQAHRALADALATNELYKKLAEDFYEEESFLPKQLIYKVKKEAPATQKQKERLYRLIDKHKLLIDYNVESLTRNQASRYADRILAEYGR